jgi:hypothetical protein
MTILVTGATGTSAGTSWSNSSPSALTCAP